MNEGGKMGACKLIVCVWGGGAPHRPVSSRLSVESQCSHGRVQSTDWHCLHFQFDLHGNV